nr:LysM peptidoglycan-binding domain-containing protein [Sinanaerobacter chloroacetimidivorans]
MPAPAPRPTPAPTPVPTPVPTPAPVCTGVIHTIRAGDTLYMLARNYNVTLDAILNANPNVNPSNLQIGSQICIPRAPGAPMPTPMPTPAPAPMPVPTPSPTPVCDGMIHTVRPGDTLYMLAKEHNVTLDAIIKANPQVDCYMLQVGMKLCIPRSAGGAAPATPDYPTPACPNGMIHTIVAGDTLYALARHHNITLDSIIKANPNLDPYNLRIGMKICIPGGASNQQGGGCPGGTLYSTQRGDTVTRILDRFEISFAALQNSNRGVDFSGSLENMTLCIPSDDMFRTCPMADAYMVKSGDTLDSISRTLLVSPDRLLIANPVLAVEDFSIIGTKVCIPS